jgi:outer membrane receptor protein involved in Fe transport
MFGGTLGWQANAFHTGAHNDILFVSSAVLGRAFFKNVAATRRQGGDIDLDWSRDDWTASLGYAYTDATFQTKLTLASEDNPFAGGAGNIHVKPGDRMPGIPANSVKALVEYHPSWRISLAMRAMSGRFLRGDESNLNPKTAPFAVFDIAASYPLFAHAELFAAIANLFDKRYETFGAFAPTGDVPIAQAPGASNPRALSPAPPREFTLGLRVKF